MVLLGFWVFDQSERVNLAFASSLSFLVFSNWKTSTVSTTDGWLKPNFASCVIRQTRSFGVLRVCSICNMVFVNYIYDMVVDTQLHKFHGRPFARVLCLFLMKDTSPWFPWVIPGSTGRFYKDDVVHNHSAHGYYTTRMEGGVRYAFFTSYHKDESFGRAC